MELRYVACEDASMMSACEDARYMLSYALKKNHIGVQPNIRSHPVRVPFPYFVRFCNSIRAAATEPYFAMHSFELAFSVSPSRGRAAQSADRGSPNRPSVAHSASFTA